LNDSNTNSFLVWSLPRGFHDSVLFDLIWFHSFVSAAFCTITNRLVFTALPSNELLRQSHKTSGQALKSVKVIWLQLGDAAVHTGYLPTSPTSPITDNEHREFGGFVLDENGNPELALFGITKLFVILLIHRRCCHSELSWSTIVYL
jgi:hypothetical protein